MHKFCTDNYNVNRLHIYVHTHSDVCPYTHSMYIASYASTVKEYVHTYVRIYVLSFLYVPFFLLLMTIQQIIMMKIIINMITTTPPAAAMYSMLNTSSSKIIQS